MRFDDSATTIVASLVTCDSTDYLKVIISLPTQTTQTDGTTTEIRKKGPGIKGTKGTKIKSAPIMTTTGNRNKGILAMAMVDSGCLAGDLINKRVLNALNGSKYLRTADSPLLVCSSLNNECLSSTEVFDTVVAFTANDIVKVLILVVRISEESSINLIFGRSTMKQKNLVELVPHFFKNPDSVQGPSKKTKSSKSKRQRDVNSVVRGPCNERAHV